MFDQWRLGLCLPYLWHVLDAKYCNRACTGQPQAILIRGLEEINGPGKVTKSLGIDKSFYGENLVESPKNLD